MKDKIAYLTTKLTLAEKTIKEQLMTAIDSKAKVAEGTKIEVKTGGKDNILESSMEFDESGHQPDQNRIASMKKVFC